MKNNIKNKLMIIVLACVLPYGQAVNGFTIGEATFSGDSFTSVGDYIAGMDWKTIGIATAIAIVTAGAASELVAVAVAEQTAMEAAIVTIDAIQAARVAGEAAAAATDAVAAGGEASLAASEAAGGLEVNQIGFTIDEATKEAADAAFNAAFDASMEASSSAAGGIPTPLIDAPIAAQAGQAASDLVIAAAKASQAVEAASAAAAQADATAQAAAIEASNTANEAARAAALLTNPGDVGAANAAGNAAGDLAFAESMEASSTAIAQAKAAAEAARVVASQASLLASEGVGSANSAAYLASLADQAAAQAAADAATQAAAQATAQAVADAAAAQAAAEAADPLTVATTAKNAASQEVFDAAQAAAQKNGVTLTQDELEEQFGEQAYAAGSKAYDASIAQSAAQSEAAAAAASPEAQAAAARQTALQTTKETYIQFATKTIDGIRSANPGMTIQTAATLSQPTLAASPQFLAYASATQAVGITLTPAMSTALFMASLAEAVPVVGEAVLGAGAGIGIASAVGTSGTPPPTAFTDKIPGATSMSPAIVAQSIAKAVYGTAATSNSCNWVSVPLAKVIPGVSATPVNLGITDPYPNYPEFLVMYYSDGSVRTVSKGDSIPSLSLGVTIIGANFGCGASPMDVTALVKVWVATNSSAVASELTFNLDPGAVEFDVSHAKLTITFNNGTSVVINRGQAINDTIAAALGVKRTVTITNNSPWTDDGVYLQCSPTTPIAKLAGNLSSNGGSTTTTFPLGYLQPSTTGSLQCPNKATIYIALRVATPTTPGQFFTFKGINITDGITIGQTGDGRMTVNGTPYSRSGDGSIPGIDLLYAGAARVAPLINKSPWSIDGVYMQCKANTPATKLAGSLSANGGAAIATYTYCSDPSDPLNKPTLPFIYVASQGQFFTFFANTIHGLTIDATTPINITPTTIGVNKMAIQPPTDNFMTVNGVKYISSGAKSIPGIDFVYPGADPAAAQTGAQASAIVKATYGVPNAAGSSCSWLDVPASFLSTINSNQGFNMNDSSGLPNFSQLKRTVILYFADGSTKSFDPDSQFSIVSMSAPALSGSYGCGTLMDVTTALRNILAAKPLATASNTTFGFDPDPGKAKVLTITLSNGMIITINEGQGISAAITAAQKGVPLPGFDYKYYLDNSPDFAVAAAANNISGAINHFYLYGFRDARPIKLTDAKGNVYTGTWNLSAYNAFKGINAAPDLQLIPIFWQAAYSGGNANGAVLTPAAAQAAAQAAAIVTAQTAANSRLPGFDVAFYVALNPTVSPAGAVDDYLKNDGGKGTKMIRLIDPSGINHDGYFVLADYILIYPDLVINNAYGYNQATTDEGRIKALFTHYQSNGYKEGRTIIFSTKAAADAIAIGIAQTAANVRLPGFNVAFYLSLHPTVSPANATQDYLDNDGGKGTTMIQLVDQIGANHTGYFVLAD
ncbi:MAG: hypothetical protein P4L31_04765, partial [Candidatus Babeliales bacterium]|nr:hypothetical protein [Candidatus Babeliales bacterium]